MWRAKCGKNPMKGGRNVYVQCVCTRRQLIVHLQKKREKEGCKGGIETRVKEIGEMKSKREERKSKEEIDYGFSM